MLSYRHSFHAGNHADVLKHTVQSLIIESLKEKDKPFLYLDTHAGAGRYQLGSANTSSTGLVKIIKDLDGDLSGKDVLIVEDILDTGITLSNLVPMLKMRNPNSVKICTILDKPSRRKADIAPDYEGFAVPDEFVVGYGLDYDEKYRNLPYIGVLKPSVYEK